MPLTSPCIRHCVLDDDDQCVGCFRTLDEILRWVAMGDVGRDEVYAELDARRAAYRRRYPLAP
jgi:predicted Fe-S protein YdhL (DUF1289 family)